MSVLPAGAALLARATVLGALADNRARALLAVAGIALGVALGVAVHVINRSAVNEFARAAATVSGSADLTVRAGRAGFDESVYARIARLPEVAAASPALELDVRIAGRRDSRDTIRLLAPDLLRTLQVQPALLGAQGIEPLLELLAGDAVLLSPAAAQWLGLGIGGTLELQAGTDRVSLRVAGLLPADGYRQRLAVMDIAGAQWRLQRLGVIHRIDVRARPGVDVAGLAQRLSALLPAGAYATRPDAEAQQAAGLSRSYRINLDMLALVALFTGAFLVFSMQAVTVLKRRPQLALLRVLGMSRRTLVAALLGEAALIGAIGAALGVALGWFAAAEGLKRLGGDLGAGYFEGVVAAPQLEPALLAAFFAVGVAIALAGAWLPAREAAAAPPAVALKPGDQEAALSRLHRRWPGLLLFGAAALLVQLPALDGLPVAGYLAIACMLLGAVALLPVFVAAALRPLPEPRAPFAQLALMQLRGAPAHATVSVAAIVVSFSLMVSMLIMIASFRQSLGDWLATVLPADLYLRAGLPNQAGFFSAEEQQRIAHLPGVARIEAVRGQSLLLAPNLPPVTLIARSLDPAGPLALPLIGSRIEPPAQGLPQAYVSEAFRDLYGANTGGRIELPVAGRRVPFTVAGIWRDYVRQSGAVLIDRAYYVELTGDRLANEVWLWLDPGAGAARVEAALRGLLPNAQFEMREPAALRALSLAAFDRTFAITYALEAVAVLIGLFGVSVSFSAQVLARRRDFGMLRHVGMTRAQIGAMLGVEGAALGGLGVGCGLALGAVVSLVLIHVINRQSFHWSMDLHVPWLPLAALGLLLIAAAMLTAVWSGRQAMGDEAVAAVKEDW